MEDTIMKKYLFIFTALCALMVFSCKKDVAAIQDPAQTTEIEMQTVTITASIAETKTSYTPDGVDPTQLNFSWTKGDQISVYCSDGNFYTFTANKTAASTTFTGAIPAGESLRSRAFFPADASHDLANYKYHIPESKDLTSHPSAEIPMIGDKGVDNTYTFTHCCGATRLTVTNIPDSFVAVEISIKSPSLKLSGTFSVFTDEGFWRWNPTTTESESEKTFTRKVAVSDHSASIYIPYASGSEWWGKNVVNITGYDALDASTSLVTDKTMGVSIGTIARAHVLPLSPLVLNGLKYIDWSGSGVVSSTVDPSDSRKCLTELKLTADAYYLYARLKGPLDIYSGDYLDIYVSDGSGENYALANNNKYWSTGGSTVYIQEHKGTITSSSLTMKFNGATVDTITEDDGDNIYWYLAIPRSAHSLTTTAGTIYVGFVLWNGWDVTGVVPTKYSSMLAIELP